MKLTELEYAALSTKSSADSIAKVARAALGSDFSFIEQAVHSAASDQRLWGKAIAAISAPTISEITAKYAAASGVASLASDAKAALGTDFSFIEQAVPSAASDQRLWGKATAAILAPTISEITAKYAAASGVASLASDTKAARAALGADFSFIEQAMHSAASRQSLWKNALTAMSTGTAVEQALHVVKSSRSIFWEDPSCLSAMAESIRHLDEVDDNFAADSLDQSPEKIAEAREVLSTAPNSDTFIQKFRDSHPLVQVIIYFIIVQIFIPQINSITANLLTPHVKLYLNEKDITKREQINKIKKLPQTVTNIDTKQLRFIAGNNVRLRKSPSTSAEILDEMVLGQIVTVLSKKRNWINVEYTYEDGTVITGWVFTIYTKRFIK